jgi:HEAT repeat protein
MRRKWLLGLILLLALTGLALWLARIREPSYQGRSASAWLDVVDGTETSLEQVAAAFRAMGADAVRFLGRELEWKPSWLGDQLWGLKVGGRLPAWLERWIPYHPDRRREAAGLLRELGPDAEPALPVLLHLYLEGHQDELVPAWVYDTLIALGEKLEFHVPELTRNLSDPIPSRRVASAHLLGSIGPKAKPAVPALQAAAQKGGWIGEAAAMALLKIDGQTNLAVQVLTEALAHTNSMLRQFVLLDLRDLGPAALPAVPRIQQALRDPDGEIREQAAKALSQISPQALDHSLGQVNQDLANQVDRLIDQARDAGFADQNRAIEALAVIGPEARKAVPVLVEILGQSRIANFSAGAQVDYFREQHALHGLKAAVARALGSIGPDARAATSLLVEQLRAHEGSFTGERTLECCHALRQIGPAAADAVPALRGLLDDANGNVRIATSRALFRIAPQHASIVHPILKQLEKDTGPWISLRVDEALIQMRVSVALWEVDRTRPCPAANLIEVLKQPDMKGIQVLIEKMCAAQLLGDIGADTKVAIPALESLLKEETSDSRLTAAIAIRKIDPEAAARLGLPGLLDLP